MKPIAFTIISLILVSCPQNPKQLLSEEQKTKLEGEIKPLIMQIMDAAKQANAEQFLDACSHSKEFIFVSMMGEFKDYSQFEIYVKGLYVDLKSEDIAEGTETFSVITDSAVLWTYIGSNMVTDKKGNQTPIRPYGLTMLVKKENGKWKTFYIHDSGQFLPLIPPTA